MQVLLKIVGGKHAGREIKIASTEFIIGRGEGSHLKPASEMVSRKHCVIKVQDGKVIVADMGSRNGSYLNDKKLTKPVAAKTGDLLRIGRLEFEFVLDPAKSTKNPKVKDVVEAASRTASTTPKKASLEDSISDWLVDEDDDSPFDDPDFDASETIQLSIDETQELVRSVEEKASDKDKENASKSDVKRIDKKVKGKLPPRPKKSHGDSTGAADDILKKLLNRR